MTKTSSKYDIAKLQRAIIDGLEDVKAHDIRVYDTEALSPLFERVLIASGTSNRQTRAIAASVVDAVQKAGFPKPRLEDTPGGSRGKLKGSGEWIIVDCGAAVAHVMQPEIRRYYNLEEIWGETPVPLATAAERKAAAKAKKDTKSAGGADDAPKAKTTRKPAAKKAASAPDTDVSTVDKAPKAPAKKAGRTTAAKTAKPAAKAPAARKAPARKVPARKPAAPAEAPVQTLVVGAAKPAAKKTAAKKPVAKKTSATKAPAKPAAKKPAAKKA